MSRFRVWGCRFKGLEFKLGLKFKVESEAEMGFRVQGLGPVRSEC